MAFRLTSLIVFASGRVNNDLFTGIDEERNLDLEARFENGILRATIGDGVAADTRLGTR